LTALITSRIFSVLPCWAVPNPTQSLLVTRMSSAPGSLFPHLPPLRLAGSAEDVLDEVVYCRTDHAMRVLRFKTLAPPPIFFPSVPPAEPGQCPRTGNLELSIERFRPAVWLFPPAPSFPRNRWVSMTESFFPSPLNSRCESFVFYACSCFRRSSISRLCISFLVPTFFMRER